MKRFHARGADLQASLAFCSKRIATAPTRFQGDVAKWRLDDPRLHFALSTRDSTPGVDHSSARTAGPHAVAQSNPGQPPMGQNQ